MGTQKVLQRQKLKICSQIMACLNENMLGSYEISHLQRVYNNIVRHLIYWKLDTKLYTQNIKWGSASVVVLCEQHRIQNSADTLTMHLGKTTT